MIQEGKYVGSELKLFEKAHNWKRYFASKIATYLKGDILEVGAGLGGTTALLCDGSQNSWLCLEPDPDLAKEIVLKVSEKKLPSICSVKASYLSEIPDSQMFDVILYIDVIEHIEDDREEVKIAFSHLKKNGVLIILVPAHQYLYSPFDKQVGHFRRYSKARLQQAIPAEATKIAMQYLDTLGYMASVANKLILKKEIPSEANIYAWDKFMIPVSRIADKLSVHLIGKSLLGVWKK